MQPSAVGVVACWLVMEFFRPRCAVRSRCTILSRQHRAASESYSGRIQFFMWILPEDDRHLDGIWHVSPEALSAGMEACLPVGYTFYNEWSWNKPNLVNGIERNLFEAHGIPATLSSKSFDKDSNTSQTALGIFFLSPTLFLFHFHQPRLIWEPMPPFFVLSFSLVFFTTCPLSNLMHVCCIRLWIEYRPHLTKFHASAWFHCLYPG